MDEGGRQRHSAGAGSRLWPADLVVAVSTLADVEFTLLEVDVLPAQAAELRGAQAGEDRGHQERPPPPFCVLQESTGFLRRRHVDPDLQPAFVAPGRVLP